MWEERWKCAKLVRGCEKLPQREVTTMSQRQSIENFVRIKILYRVSLYIFGKKNDLEHTENWYEHLPEGAVENEEVKKLRDINVQCYNVKVAQKKTRHNCNWQERSNCCISWCKSRGKGKTKSGKVPGLLLMPIRTGQNNFSRQTTKRPWNRN